jgi:hypothetical protein
MKRVFIIGAALFLSALWQPALAETALTSEVNEFINLMARSHQPAFVSTCNVIIGADKNFAGIIFSPRANKGVFVYGKSQKQIANNANLEWANSGEWSMSELEGGAATVPIMSDLFYQLTRAPFRWASPNNMKRVWNALPSRSCKLLKI